MSAGDAGALRVWWIPQVPGEPFHVPVKTPQEAKALLDTLARYDQFQLDHRIKGDYCNVGGLEVFEADGDGYDWCEWYDDKTGHSISEIDVAALSASERAQEPVATLKCWEEPRYDKPPRALYELKLTDAGNTLPPGEYTLFAAPSPLTEEKS